MSRRTLLERAALGLPLLAAPVYAAAAAAGSGTQPVAPSTSLDHVLWGCADLTLALDEFERRTGVRAAIGGRHPGRGTHNALASLGGARYLELIAVDPAQQADNAMVSRLKPLAAPRLVTWAVATPAIEALEARVKAAGLRTGGIQAGSRTRPDGRRLSWRTLALDGDDTGLVPFVIEWGAGTPHPSQDAPGGCTFRSLVLEHPEPAAVARLLDALDVQPLGTYSLREGSTPRLRLEIETPKGRVALE